MKVALIVIGGVLVIGGGLACGLSDYTKRTPTRAQRSITKAEAKVAKVEKVVESMLAQEKAFLEGRPELKVFRAAIKKNRAAIKTAKLEKKLMEEIIAKNSKGDRSKIYASSRKIRKLCLEAAKGLTKLTLPLKKIMRYKERAPQYASMVKSAELRTKLYPSRTLPGKIKKIVRRYPDKKAKLAEHLAKIGAAKKKVLANAAKYRTARAAQPVDYVATGVQAELVKKDGLEMSRLNANLHKDIRLLPSNVDKVLYDLRQKLSKKYIKLRVITDGRLRTTTWLPVSFGVFNRLKPYMGMVVYSKPAGKLGSEADLIAAPPGYAYVGNKEYGQWMGETDATKKWQFHDRYRYMTTAHWGPGYYVPITMMAFLAYQRAHRLSQPYYGPGRRYGTNGTLTKRRFGSSFYFISLRTRSRYRRSGSRYGGSRRSSYGGYGK